MEYKVTCPYCHEKFSMVILEADGNSQEFTYDCEVCCHPIDILANWDQGHHKFKLAVRKNAGYDDYSIDW